MTRSTTQFICGDQIHEIASCDPSMTVLDWLRLSKRRTGTKEGCAEGDCGACTVVIGQPDGNGIRYEAVNSCIRFVPMLDGCHLLTIEDLRRQDGSLHPLQQAMVEHHGSQCGFCTPGILMSLFALWLNRDRLSAERIEEALAGNLCRCTGYRPIIDAALAAFSKRGDMKDTPLAGGETAAEWLSEHKKTGALHFSRQGRQFDAPTTITELAQIYSADPDALLIAGATDIALKIATGAVASRRIIHLGHVDELRRVDITDHFIRLGAMTSHRQTRGALATISPQFDELMRRFGGEQIRNAGTIGGNIANGSPVGDLAPGLIALDAMLVLRRGRQQRRLAISEFFIAYGKQDLGSGEFIEAVEIPRLKTGALFSISKVSKRFDEDISALSGAFLIERDHMGLVANVRLAFGGMAGIPARARRAEAALIGRPWSADGVEAAIEALPLDFDPLSDTRASRAYRLLTAGNLIRRAVIETTQPDVTTRVAGQLAGAGRA